MDKSEGTERSYNFPILLTEFNNSYRRYDAIFHAHDKCEFVRVISGNLLMVVDGVTHNIDESEIFFVAPDRLHGNISSDCDYECLKFDPMDFVQSGSPHKDFLSMVLGGGYDVTETIKKDSETGKIINEIFDAIKYGKRGFELVASGLLMMWLGTVASEDYTEVSVTNQTLQKNSRQIKKAIAKIEEEYASALTLESLAQTAGLNPQYFCRVFRKMTGRTPVDYLNYFRIERATELLCTDHSKITEVANKCGFQDLSYFNRCFKKQKGLPPSRFKKNENPKTTSRKARNQ